MEQMDHYLHRTKILIKYYCCDTSILGTYSLHRECNSIKPNGNKNLKAYARQ